MIEIIGHEKKIKMPELPLLEKKTEKKCNQQEMSFFHLTV